MLVSLLWATYFAEVIRGRKSSDLGLHWDIWAAGVLKALAAACEECAEKNALDNVFFFYWSFENTGRGCDAVVACLECAETQMLRTRVFFILKRLGIGIVSFIERVSTTITAQGVNKQPNLLNTAIFSEFVCWAEPAEISILSHRKIWIQIKTSLQRFKKTS